MGNNRIADVGDPIYQKGREMTAALMTTPKLPRYMQKANMILQAIAEQPDGIWSKTQRELCMALGISQPESSNLIKMLIDHDKIMKGAPIPGVRGKNHILIAKDPTPFEEVVQRTGVPQAQFHPRDRVAVPTENITGVSDLRQYDAKVIGEAVIHALKEAWEEKENYVTTRNEQNARLREYREQMQKDRQMRIHLADERELLQQQVEELEQEKNALRKELNEMLMRAPDKHQQKATYPFKEALDEESRRMLDQLMRMRPGNYRESDAQLGLPPESKAG